LHPEKKHGQVYFIAFIEDTLMKISLIFVDHQRSFVDHQRSFARFKKICTTHYYEHLNLKQRKS